MPLHIQQQLQACNNDLEELLLELYFELKNCNSYFMRKALVEDYNLVVRSINNNDPYKHYREAIA